MDQAEIGRNAVGVVETDAFCERCSFNLHTQKVWRDDRLGIMVCRCPECGAHHAAGEKSGATSIWLRRVALMALLAWTLLGVMFIIGIFFLGVGIQAVADEGLTYRTTETRDGRTVIPDYSLGAAGPRYLLPKETSTAPDVVIPTNEVVMRRRVVPWLRGAPMPDTTNWMYGQPSTEFEAILTTIGLAIPWYGCAVILAVAAWFWRPLYRWMLLILPILSAGFVYTIVVQEAKSRSRAMGSMPMVDDVSASVLIVGVALASVALMAIGLATGRPVARLLLSMFVPPKARQLCAFLWHCDGKTMPMAAKS